MFCFDFQRKAHFHLISTKIEELCRKNLQAAKEIKKTYHWHHWQEIGRKNLSSGWLNLFKKPTLINYISWEVSNYEQIFKKDWFYIPRANYWKIFTDILWKLRGSACGRNSDLLNLSSVVAFVICLWKDSNIKQKKYLEKNTILFFNHSIMSKH